jgi:hypothetical protein
VTDGIDLRKDDDPRWFMNYDQPYPQDSPGLCTFCPATGVRSDLTLVKQHWANRSAGQLQSRCPAHQSAWNYRHLLKPVRQVPSLEVADGALPDEAIETFLDRLTRPAYVWRMARGLMSYGPAHPGADLRRRRALAEIRLLLEGLG